VLTIFLLCRLNPKLAPASTKTTWKEKVFSMSLTWPVVLLFILTGVINEPLGVLYRGIIPFVIADICHVALLIAVPSLSTFLPNLM